MAESFARFLMHPKLIVLALLPLSPFRSVAQPPQPSLPSPMRSVDLNVGESTQIELPDSKKINLKLLDVRETRDELRKAVRRAEVSVEVNGQQVMLVSANYRLPATIAGVQIDCPVTKGYLLGA